MDYVILVLTVLLYIPVLRSLPYGQPRAVAEAARAAPGKPAWAAPWSSVASWLRQRHVIPWLLLIAGLLAAALLLRWTGGFLKLVLLTRYSLLTGLFLVGLVPIALQGAPSLLGSLFVLRRPVQLFHIAWLSVLTGTMVVVTARVVEVNAVDPYGTPLLIARDAPSHGLRTLAVLLLSLPLSLACFLSTRAAVLKDASWNGGRWLTAGLLGLLSGLVLVVIATVLQEIFLSDRVQDANLFPLQGLSHTIWQELLHEPRFRVLYPVGDFLPQLFGDHSGYKVLQDGKAYLAPGHAQLALAMVLVGLVYLLGYLAGLGGKVPSATSPFVSLSYLLLLLLLLGMVLQGLAFALDRYYLPVSLVVVLFSFLLYQVTDTDHFFELAPPGSRSPAPAPLDLVEALRRHPFPRTGPPEASPGRTLVAVTASGGGIQAAAWTCRVLTGLHELYGPDFSRSIFLISAVSGGSVGTLYYLDRWQPQGPPLLPADLREQPDGLPDPQTILGKACASSLEATAWGLAYPDLLRILFPPLVSSTDDRGTRIEQAWRSRLTEPDRRLTDWIEPIRSGQMPIPVFNSTLVETGQRLLASPVVGRRPTGEHEPWDAHELLQLYPGAAPRVSTVVRLSATFPFVSPICRPLPTKDPAWSEDRAYHVADGGYVDNEGMVTVINWLYNLLDPQHLPFEERVQKFDRILLVRIMPFPAGQVPPAKRGQGWFYSTWGPIETLMNVRTTSQQERNDLAVRLFDDALTDVLTAAPQGRQEVARTLLTSLGSHPEAIAAGEDPEQRTVQLLSAAAAHFDVPVAVARFTFESAVGRAPPLSWMMTALQQAAINRAWNELRRSKAPDHPLSVVDRFFGRVGPAAARG